MHVDIIQSSFFLFLLLVWWWYYYRLITGDDDAGVVALDWTQMPMLDTMETRCVYLGVVLLEDRRVINVLIIHSLEWHTCLLSFHLMDRFEQISFYFVAAADDDDDDDDTIAIVVVVVIIAIAIAATDFIHFLELSTHSNRMRLPRAESLNHLHARSHTVSDTYKNDNEKSQQFGMRSWIRKTFA